MTRGAFFPGLGPGRSDAARPRRGRQRLLRAISAALALGCLLASAMPAAADPLAEGAAAFAAGRHREAVAAWTSALDAAQDAGARQAALAHRAEAYLALAHDDRAIADLQAALTLARDADDPTGLARLRGQLGKAYLLAGRNAAAATELHLALALARRAGGPALQAAIENDLGNLAAVVDPAAAPRRYEDSARLAAQAGDGALLAAASINLARLALAGGDHGGAETRLRAAHAALLDQPPGAGRIADLTAVGRLLLEAGRQAGQSRPATAALAYASLREALASAETVGDTRGRAYALGYLGELYEGSGRLDEALRLTRAALFDARAVAAPEIVYRWQWQLGRLWRTKGDLAAAQAAYQQAIATLQSIRNDMVFGYSGGESSFQRSVRPVFVELADLLLREADSLTGEAATEKIRTARETVELLRTAELEEYFQDECVAALQAKATGIDQLAPGTAALYPIVLPDRLELLLSLPDGLTRRTVAVGEAAIAEAALRFRQLLEKRTTRQYLRPARELHDWLIEPILPQLRAAGVDTLVLIPNGPFLTIPLAALHDGERHLVESLALAVVPGLTLLDPQPIARGEVQVLINGLTEAVQGFAPLPAVALEVSEIRRVFGGRVLQDREFVLDRMQRELDATPYTMVHIASHAQIAADARDSFLLAYDGKLSMDGLERFVKLSQFRDDPVELLTLSACATAAGDERAALGLAGIAIKAGARSAVASLWFINDEGTSRLVGDFYRRLADPAVSKAKALQAAQLALMRDRLYQHPIYWAPFLLIGNWL